jgi:hypothetical protein
MTAHGTFRTWRDVRPESVMRSTADMTNPFRKTWNATTSEVAAELSIHMG